MVKKLYIMICRVQKYHIKQKIQFYLIAPNLRKSWTMLVLRSPPWLGWPLWNICVTNDHGYVLLVVNTSRFFPHSRLITGFVTRLTRRVTIVEQELLTLPEHMSSPAVFSGVRVTRSLTLYVCFVDRCLSFCTFSFGHYVVCFSIYGFLLPLWYLQTLLEIKSDCEIVGSRIEYSKKRKRKKVIDCHLSVQTYKWWFCLCACSYKHHYRYLQYISQGHHMGMRRHELTRYRLGGKYHHRKL